MSGKPQKFLDRVVRISRPVILLSILFLFGLSLLTPFAFSTMYQVGIAEPGSLPAFAFLNPDPTPTVLPGTPEATPIPLAEPLPLAEPWDGSSRVTVLLLGLDYRDWAAGEGPPRSDTMILMTIDPVTLTAGILSVPRDLWAAIPGFKPGKINTAFALGEAYKVPGGGGGLAARTIEATLGVPIDYYAQIDFSAFIRFIDLIDGVKIDVPAPIRIDPLDPTIPTKFLEPGVQTLPGEWALGYARVRNADGGDFARADRQQQIVMGIRDRILRFDLLPLLIANAPEIYNELSTGINTNMRLDDAIKLATLALQVNREDIKTAVIGESYFNYGTSPDNLSILIPLPDRIRTLRDEIFSTGGALSPLTPGDSLERMQLEGARIAIQNGTLRANLGTRTSDYLESLGAQIVSVENIEVRHGQTSIVDYTGNPFTMQYLVDMLNIHQFYIDQFYNPDSTVDILLILGDTWLNNNTLP